MSKKKLTLKVECVMCKTHVDLDVVENGLRIISTDQAAGFIQMPKYICEKCQSVCLVNLVVD